MENYNFTFYQNKATSSTAASLWRKDYFTYLEIKAICYKFGDDCGLSMKATWLDRIACALYEKHDNYVFVNGVYQCSCDLYHRKFPGSVTYQFKDNKIVLNQPAYNPSNGEDRWYMYLAPGRCGIPVTVSGIQYYVTAGQTYVTANNNKVTVNRKMKFSDTTLQANDISYLSVVSNDETSATLYEGWDYITNNMASLLVVACDKDTGNIITINSKQYSEFSNVSSGAYTKTSWEIDGYDYLGYLTKDNFSAPTVPIGIADTEKSVNLSISADEAQNGAKKQIIFVYQKTPSKNEEKEARLSIYSIGDSENKLIYTGKYFISSDGVLEINFYDTNNVVKYSETLNFDIDKGYNVSTNFIEEKLNIDLKYLGYLIKNDPEYFLAYFGEELLSDAGNIYDLKSINEEKVHIILGYEEVDGSGDNPVDDSPSFYPPALKISYLDENGNLLEDQLPIVTDEEIGKDIISKAKDFKTDNYMYIGYTYVDTMENFGTINSPINILGETDAVTTKFTVQKERRHIAFIYKKIEITFEMDVNMELNPNDIDNQLINQKVDEDYWVLDTGGKVSLKIIVTGNEGLNITSYAVKLRIPFDTYMNGSFVSANSVNNLSVSDLSNIIVADKLVVPIWVEEKVYNIDAVLEANVEGFGMVSTSKSDNVEVVGRLYDFTVTNLDGSEKTGDDKWHESLFGDENNEYKANSIPVGQSINQPEKYNYGIKLGTAFYFSVNTKGLNNDAISIVPKFLYVNADGTEVKEVDVYYNDNGKTKNILTGNLSSRYMKLRDDNILKTNVIREIERAQIISKVLERYNYQTTTNVGIGTLANTVLPKELSLPYLNYINEFKDLYGVNAISLSGKTENELLTYASHWYGKYVIPASSKVVDKGATYGSQEYKDGYLIVCFKIISLDSDGNGYLDYNLPMDNTQWQKENLNQILDLPIIKANDISKSLVIDTLKDGYAPAIIYQVGASINDNNDSVGTH